METLQRASLWEKMNADEAAFFFLFLQMARAVTAERERTFSRVVREVLI